MPDPVCALCDGPMVTVRVVHKRGNTTLHQLCRACVSSLVKPQLVEPAVPPSLSIVRSAS